MNKQGNWAIKVLLVLVLIVVVSGVTLSLVKAGVLTPSGDQEEVLNAEFLPLGREGALDLRAFDLCSYINNDLDCLEKVDTFIAGDDIYVRFLVESSVENGQVSLIRNYRLIDPLGKVVYDIDERENYHVDMTSSKDKDFVGVADYIITEIDFVSGEYILEVVITNLYSEKEVRARKMFTLIESQIYDAEDLLDEEN